MTFRTTLIWTFFLFCGIVTFQFLLNILVTLMRFYNPLYSINYSFDSLIYTFTIALATSLTTLVLVKNKFTLRIPLFIRIIFHFLLTLGILLFILFTNNLLDLSQWWTYQTLFFFLVFYFLAFYCFHVSIKIKEQKQRDQIEHEYLRTYTHEVESQYNAVNQLKHDYQNILFSLKIYLDEGDLPALKEFFKTKILSASWVITKEDFVLRDVEIKNLPIETPCRNFKNMLKWITLLFCVAITFQLLFLFIVVIITRYNYLDIVVFPFWNSINILVVALSCSIPVLVLTDSKITSRVPLAIRHLLHFLMMAVIISVLLFSFNSDRLTSNPYVLPLIESSYFPFPHGEEGHLIVEESQENNFIFTESEEGQLGLDDSPELKPSMASDENIARIYSPFDFYEALADPKINILCLGNDILFTGTPKTLDRSLTIHGNYHWIIFSGTHFQLGRVPPREVILRGSGVEASDLPGATLTLNQVNFHGDFASSQDGGKVNYFFFGTKKDTSNWDVVIQDSVVTGELPTSLNHTSLRTTSENQRGLLNAPGARVVIQGRGNILSTLYPEKYSKNQHHQLFIHRLELRPQAQLKVYSKGNAETALRIEGENSRIFLEERAKLRVMNSGNRSLLTYDQNENFQEGMPRTIEREGTPSSSNGIYGSIDTLEMRSNSTLNITTTNIGFRSITSLYLSMVDGARLTIDGDNKRGAFIVASGSEIADWEDTANTHIHMSGVGTQMTLSSENWFGGHPRGENINLINIPDYVGNPGSGGYTGTMRIIGNTSSIHLTNGATLRIGEPDTLGAPPTSRGTALLVMGEGFSLNIESDARLIALSRQAQTFVRTGATLATRQGGTLHFYGIPDEGYQINLVGGHIKATNYGAGPGIRINGGNSRIRVTEGGSIHLSSISHPFPSYNIPVPPQFTPQSAAIQFAHSRGTRDQLHVSGENSKVWLYSQGGSAIRGSILDIGSIVGVYVGENAIFYAEGNCCQGVIYGYLVDFQVNAPSQLTLYNNASNSASLLYSIAQQWRELLLIIPIFSIVFFLSTTFLSRKEYERKLKTKKELLEIEIYQEYLHKIQQQYATMNVFKKDYQNILSTLNKYLEEDDLSGLREYYYSQIATTFEEMNKSTFVFQHLDKIKIPEIKSIFITKLMLAQSLHIQPYFTVNEEITSIPMNTLALVRMLGIILDNAIEAQRESIYIGCFKSEKGIYFIVENPLPKELPPFHKLWEKNFTTKEGNQGLGLSNLLEIIGQIPNATLETDITEKSFIQKIIITKEERS